MTLFKTFMYKYLLVIIKLYLIQKRIL